MSAALVLDSWPRLQISNKSHCLEYLDIFVRNHSNVKSLEFIEYNEVGVNEKVVLPLSYKTVI